MDDFIADVAHAPTSERAPQSTGNSASIDVTPTAVAIEVDSCYGGAEPENTMEETRLAGSMNNAKPCSMPSLETLAQRPSANPNAQLEDGIAPRHSARSSQPTTPSSVSGRTPARSRRSPGASPQCAAGRAGLRQRGKDYVAKAQECWSRWRREKLEAHKLEAKGGTFTANRTAKCLLVVQQHGAEELDDILEVRGVAAPRTPVSNRLAGGSLAAARVLYTPPTRRAKATRV